MVYNVHDNSIHMQVWPNDKFLYFRGSSSSHKKIPVTKINAYTTIICTEGGAIGGVAKTLWQYSVTNHSD